MIPFHSRFVRNYRSLRAAAAVSACVTTALLSGALHAKPIPDNLGNGLDKLVESNLARNSAKKNSTQATVVGTDGLAYLSEQAANYAANSLVDTEGRILVRINADGTLNIRKLRKSLRKSFGSFTATAVDKKYRGVGVMNAYVSLDEVAALAQAPGIKSVILELRPQLRRSSLQTAALKQDGTNAVPGDIFPKLGRAFDQGVTQHRVDRINRFYTPSATLDYEGTGMQIGFLSDSYDNQAGAAAGVTNFDLPGAATGHPTGNNQPVYVLEDLSDGTGSDEGRAMVEIGHKMAPKARLAFASAFTGEVGFANNIRGLAGIPGFTKPGQTFAADSICDDVGYGDEPFYQDGIIGAGVDDAAAFGVSYFSSAANDPGINGYESPARFVPNGTGVTAAAGNTALTGTNIDLTGVPANLYAGGFHNFNPNGLDVAQTVNVPAASSAAPATSLQWDEPYDQNTTPNLVQPPLYTTTGSITSATAVTITIPTSLTQGTLYQVNVTATSGTLDSIVTIRDPNNNVIVNAQDTGTDEAARFFAPVSGTGYTVSVSRFGTSTGNFSLNLYATNGFSSAGVVTDINLLAFNVTTGAYVPGSSLVANNFATNQPIEYGVTARVAGSTQLQYVIARGNVPASNGATHLRYLISTNGSTTIGPAEYFNYDTVATRGHSMAAGCNGSAAYSVFRPNIPEGFTSPGPVVIYFDKQGNRLPTPQVRLQPAIAAADGANTSFFSGDSGNDQDTSPNFSGTSAAAPHGAALAALVIESHGGRRSLTPAQVTRILQSTAFPHDLDPYRSTGTAKVTGGAAGKVTITAISNNGTGTGTGSNDNNAISVSYIGSSSLTSLVFNPGGTAATAGNTSGGNNGVTYTGNTTGGTVAYFEGNFPGIVWAPASKAFTLGGASTVPLTAFTTPAIPATFANLAGTPSTTQSYTMTLSFNSGAFTGGNILRFSVGRAIQRSASITAPTTAVNYQADLLGGSISIPSGTGTGVGMTFSGTTADGGTFTGTINNRLGNGYATLDGFGFINAEAAVIAPSPVQ